MSLLNTNENAFGLDISDRNLRLIQLKKKGKKFAIQLYNEIKLPPDCISGGEVKDAKIFLNSLNKLIKTKHGRGKLRDEVVSVLPEDKTFLKVINIPVVGKDKIKSTIAEVLPQHMPLNIEDIYFDWQIIQTTEQNQTVLIGASPKNIVDSYVQILSESNLMPTALEIESAAIARVLIDPADKNPQIIIDIGANRTGLFLYDSGTIKFTVTLPISGNNITQLIADTLELDFEKAEKTKMLCGFDKTKCNGALLEILSETINELVTHINQAIDFYTNNFPANRPIEKIILCGGGASFKNITNVLQEKLKLPVIISNPWQNIINPNPHFFNPEKGQSFITAMGLAMRTSDYKTYL